MKKMLVLALACTCGIAAAQAQTAKDVIRLHNKAIGGEKTWNAIKTVRIEQGKEMKFLKQLADSAKAMGMPAVAMKETLTYINGKGVRRENNIMGITMYSITTPRMSYIYVPSLDDSKPAKLDSLLPKNPQKVPELVRFSDPLMRTMELNGNATFAGTEVLNGQKVYKLNVTEAGDTDTSAYYIDAATGYTLRTVLYSKMSPEGFITDYSNFQTLSNGMVIPMLEENNYDKTTITAIQLNIDADESILKPYIPKGTIY